MSRTISKVTSKGIPQTITYSDITLDKLEVGQYQKEGTITAQIRQTVTTVAKYPSTQVTSDKQENLFGASDFNFTSKDFSNTETRVAWIDVPATTSKEAVLEKLKVANTTGATIYKMMSNQPILTNNQKNALKNGLGGVTLDVFANAQVVRFPMEVSHPQEGQICLDTNGKVQYRRTFFWNTPLEDQDLRSVDSNDSYMSPEITLELSMAPASVHTSVMEGQGL